MGEHVPSGLFDMPQVRRPAEHVQYDGLAPLWVLGAYRVIGLGIAHYQHQLHPGGLLPPFGEHPVPHRPVHRGEVPGTVQHLAVHLPDPLPLRALRLRIWRVLSPKAPLVPEPARRLPGQEPLNYPAVYTHPNAPPIYLNKKGSANSSGVPFSWLHDPFTLPLKAAYAHLVRQTRLRSFVDHFPVIIETAV